MEEEGFKLRKSHLAAFALGGLGGALVVYLATKWLPEYQEKIAKRQGEIIGEEVAKKVEKILREYRCTE